MALIADNIWLLLPLAAGLSALLCAALIPLARRTGLLDQPAVRKVHDQATPLIGGLAIFAAIAAALFVAHAAARLPSDVFWPAVVLGSGLLLLTGLIDDLRGLSATVRFLVQIGVCLLIIKVTGVRLDDFGPLFTTGILKLGWLAVPITVFAAMGVINSLNLIDGMDGLAGSVFAVAAGGMVLFAGLAGQADTMWMLLAILAAVLGFLMFNARLPWNARARVFLGDAGSLMLGFLAAWSLILLGNGADRAFMPMTAVWLFAVPLLDTSTMIWMRWRSGRSAFAADQRHLHHAFLRAGFSVAQTWGAITLLAVVMAGLGVVFEWSGLPGFWSFYAFMALAFTYYFYLRQSWRNQRFLGRHFVHHDFVIETPRHYPPTGAARE